MGLRKGGAELKLWFAFEGNPRSAQRSKPGLPLQEDPSDGVRGVGHRAWILRRNESTRR